MNNIQNSSRLESYPVVPAVFFFAAAVALTACGGGGGGSGGSTPVSSPPTAADIDVVTIVNTAATDSLVATDPEGDPLTFSIASNGSLGTAVITDPSKGTFVYTPNPDTAGTDSFTYQASDGSLESSPATVTVTINVPPVANDGCDYTPQPATVGAPPYTGVLDATDPDSSQLTYSLVGGATDTVLITAKGEVNITDRTTGAFSYKPKPLDQGGGRGLDNFSFRVTDADGATASAIHRIVVNQTIMPLGDSITVGDTDALTSTATTVGYRKPLHDSLKNNAGIGFDFVGTEDHGTAFSGFDFNHEGHGGWTASEIAWGKSGNGGVYSWLNSNPANFILLHAGTNGLNPGGDIDIEVILDEIDRWETERNAGKQVTVLLALIIDQAPVNQDVTDFNNLLLDNSRIANDDNVIFVNQQTGAGLDYTVGSGDMAEKLHPNANGYAKMAAKWLDTLRPMLDQCP